MAAMASFRAHLFFRGRTGRHVDVAVVLVFDHLLFSRGTLGTGDSRDLDDGAGVRRDLSPEEHKSSLLRRRRLVRNAFLGLSDSPLKMQNMATSAFSNVFVIPRKRHQLFSRGGDVQSGSHLVAAVVVVGDV